MKCLETVLRYKTVNLDKVQIYLCSKEYKEKRKILFSYSLSCVMNKKINPGVRERDKMSLVSVSFTTHFPGKVAAGRGGEAQACWDAASEPLTSLPPCSPFL